MLAPIHETRCAFLYEVPFLASARIMAMTDADRTSYLTDASTLGNTVLVTLNQGDRAEIRALPFDAWHNQLRVVDVLQQIIAAGLTPIVVLTDQTYFTQTLKRSVDRFYDCLESCSALVAPVCSGVIGMWEVGEIFGDDEKGLTVRRELNHRIRAGTVAAGVPTLRIGVHERGGHGIRAQDIPSTIGPSMSCLQTGFRMTQDDMVEFVSSNVTRMAGYAARGQIDPGHLVGVMEHSIPAVYEGQPWSPTRTSREAYAWGRRIIADGGAAFDWSGGSRSGVMTMAHTALHYVPVVEQRYAQILEDLRQHPGRNQWSREDRQTLSINLHALANSGDQAGPTDTLIPMAVDRVRDVAGWVTDAVGFSPSQLITLLGSFVQPKGV